MNPYLQHLSKIELVVTDACTGQCRHCSEGTHTRSGVTLDADVAAQVVCRIASAYAVETVMAFGGEPLLCPETVAAVMNAAVESRVAKRQLITNGCFSNDASHIRHVARWLSACGVNDVLVSVDAFHQETLPLDTVRRFVAEVQAVGVPIRWQPAWLVSAEHDNPYNRRTREILAELAPMNVPVGMGNVIFPEGNARRYLAAYFREEVPTNPYVEDPFDVRCVSVSANGDLLADNVYRRDALEILHAYTP